MHKTQEIWVTDVLLLIKVSCFQNVLRIRDSSQIIVWDYWHIAQIYESRYLGNFNHMGKGVNVLFENANRL